LRAAHGDRLVLHRARGHLALSLIPTPDLLLLDGDPNWFSVQSALEAARTQAARLGLPFPLTLAANAGWPYARRDAYADPAAIPDAYRFTHERAGVAPGKRDLCAGNGLFVERFHATAENEPRLGVLTAIEDFLLGFPGEAAQRPSLTVLPFAFGLAVLVPLARRAALAGWLDTIAMGSAARALAAETEQLRTACAASEADLRRAFESERIRNDRLAAALRDARADAARWRQNPSQSAAAPTPPAPQVRASLPRRALRLVIRNANRLRGHSDPPPEPDAMTAEIERVRQTPVFDAAWYLAANPDVAAANVDPAAHFVRSGAGEGRDPGPYFFTAWYLDAYPDVAVAGLNPLLHYLASGAAEGRDPGPHFATAAYRERYTDVAKAGLNPLEHWIACGRAEGRRG